MDIYEITVPNEQNDFIMRVPMDGKPRTIHMSYNSGGDFWTIGYCDDDSNPIVDGIKIIPNYPLNIWYTSYEIPQGLLYVRTSLERVGRYAFRDGLAALCYVPESQL